MLTIDDTIALIERTRNPLDTFLCSQCIRQPRYYDEKSINILRISITSRPFHVASGFVCNYGSIYFSIPAIETLKAAINFVSIGPVNRTALMRTKEISVAIPSED